MDVTSLISGFGGNLGLFAGMSLITIVQCLAAFICACHDKWNGNFVGPVNESNESPETNDLNLIESLSPESLYGDTNYSAWGSPIYL